MTAGARGKSSVRFARRGAVATITLAASRGGNRFDLESAALFVEACERADEDDVGCVVLQHRGADFCLGLVDPRACWPDSGRSDFVGALARIRAPVIAAIDGRAAAEGFELALAADLRIVGPGASFLASQVAEGRIPSFGATQRLPRIVGSERALEMILLGRPLGARAALAAGLVTRVAREPGAAAARLARVIASRAPIALRFAKEAVRRAADLSLDDGARLEHDLYSLLQTTDDRAEGVRSFVAKRSPRFRGR